MCNGSMVWMSQPLPNQPGPLINKILYLETINLFQRASILHHKQGYRNVCFPEQISMQLQRLRFETTYLECLGHGSSFELNTLTFSNLKTVILTKEPVSVGCSTTIHDDLSRLLKAKALGTGDESMTFPLTYMTPSNPSMYEEMAELRFKHTKNIIKSRGISICFPFTYQLQVVTTREMTRTFYYRSIKTVSEDTFIKFQSQPSLMSRLQFISLIYHPRCRLRFGISAV